MKIRVATDAADMRDVEMIHESPSAGPEDVIVYPSDALGDLPWHVVDNRNHEAFNEGFETLDGAIAYAADVHVTSERQHLWDTHGHLRNVLLQHIRNENAVKNEEDPARVTKGMDECDDRDELVAALADNVVVDPEDVHSVETTGTESAEGVLSNLGVEVTFRNVVGQTARVDGILETLSIRDWRVFCDKFLEKALESTGRNADAYDWPTPHPEVTKVPEEEDTDVIASVRVKWRLDEKTWSAVKSFVESKVQRRAGETGEETCLNCNVQIGYRVEKGKNVVTCPECGAVNPLCSECTRPEHEKNACSRCRIHLLCRRMNAHMAKRR